MHWDVNRVDVSGELVAAFASSESDGRDRWTELRVYYMPDQKRPWLAEARGVSLLPNEGDKIRRIASAKLERALNLFDETDLGIIVKEGAREYAEEHGIPKGPASTNQPADGREALARLFGTTPEALSINAAAKALGMGEGTLRHALSAGRDVRVSLRALLPYVDYSAFQRDQEKRRG